MTTTTEANRTKPATNPHQVSTLITGWAIPLVLLAALWGAGHQPAHAEWSAFAFAAIVVIHVAQRIRRNLWNRQAGK